MDYIKSPFNYTGGKHKLLKQILPLFPDDIDQFVDLFSGGCNVGINVVANNKKFIDFNPQLIELLNVFKAYEIDIILSEIENIIKTYDLSDSSVFGYDYYGCTSSDGLANYNREKFLNLRNDYNSLKHEKNGFKKNIMLYTLIVFGFNNQIRFNKQGNYNIPVGKRDFNSKIKSNLIIFLKNIKDSNSEFINVNFKCLTANDFKGSFVYADPPYLITNASYNEQGGWAEDCEYKLYELLDSLNRNNINFALSNVIENKGTKNTILESWITNNDYKIHYLDMSYNNSNYQIKDRSNKTVEVLITNY